MYQFHRSLSHLCGHDQVPASYSPDLGLLLLLCTDHFDNIKAWCAPISLHWSNLLLSMAMLASCAGICPAAAALDHDGGCCIWADFEAVDADFAPCSSSKCSRCALSIASCCFKPTLCQRTSPSPNELGTCKELDTRFFKRKLAKKRSFVRKPTKICDKNGFLYS